ncbi:MAG TPA: nitronate monooxygenase, partial [Luteibaculaceae bacterium]|nr:nitronate monooxygenase [Luteibaculaceae bacterium]
MKIDFPVIMAPMFLVSNQEMVVQGMKSGIMATFPTLNYRRDGELEAVLDELNKALEGQPGSYGVNLIVQETNLLYKKHLAICVEKKVPFYITSLGNPTEVIQKAHAYGGKVFCDVTNLKHAQKVASLGCDGFIAVGAGAGGHAGPNALHVLIDALRTGFPQIPVVAAGGVANGRQLHAMMVLGAAGASIGTRFIATTEASVSDEYKNAIVDAKMDDIVMTEKISGTPCAIIN